MLSLSLALLLLFAVVLQNFLNSFSINLGSDLTLSDNWELNLSNTEKHTEKIKIFLLMRKTPSGSYSFKEQNNQMGSTDFVHLHYSS